jgi:hypothetical protein
MVFLSDFETCLPNRYSYKFTVRDLDMGMAQSAKYINRCPRSAPSLSRFPNFSQLNTQRQPRSSTHDNSFVDNYSIINHLYHLTKQQHQQPNTKCLPKLQRLLPQSPRLLASMLLMLVCLLSINDNHNLMHSRYMTHGRVALLLLLQASIILSKQLLTRPCRHDHRCHHHLEGA